jgi:hypothetical protein
MFKLVNQELHDLTRPLDFITTEDARVAVKAVIEKLTCATDAYIVDVYWKKKPVKGGDVLDPFVWIRTESSQPSSIIITEEEGILPWVFKNGKVAWIDEVKAKDWSKPVLNLAAVDALKFEQKYGDISQDYNEEIDKYIQPSSKIDSFSEATDAIISLPLKHRGIIWGLISLEFKKPKPYDSDLLKQLKKITPNLACLIWKSDIYEQNNAETHEAVLEFSKLVSKEEAETVPLTDYPSCFFSRQFDEAGKFEKIEKKVGQIVSNSKIILTSFRPQAKDFVVKQIIDNIKSSHFCIADITEQNPNVMIELGMMMMYQKDIIIFKSSDDDSPIPFDINQSNIYTYKWEKDELCVRNTSGSGFIPFKAQLEKLAEGYIKQQE